MITSSLLKDVMPIHDFDAPRAEPLQGRRLRAVRTAAERVRERFASGPRVVCVRTINQTTLPYPTKYAFNSAAFSPAPFVTLTHRCVLVQFMQRGSLKNLLFNPTDIIGARRAPYFARLADRFHLVEPLLSKQWDSVPYVLASIGIKAGDIDYVAFDHFHTQDLRGLLGTRDNKRQPLYPNAVLLAPRVEWDDWDELHPLQASFFVRDGKENVREDNVAFLDGDISLGDGVMLLRTPGHTSGNQTLFIHTDNGVWGISENGTSADNWSPLESKIAGLANVCRNQDLDVILNSNTPESAADQYTSMILERTIVDRVKRAPSFVQMFPSSEVTPSLLAPGLRPTVIHGEIRSGELTKPEIRAPRREAEMRA
ncbi:hypothetical protein LZC95_11945 [Pendulispora brunnea]|uniref:Metallo-beta-lactamase domain-containing protein n=1 Tax=Pendulispora brunnea TaxID=2905690 RepID=A0ABZ2KFV7_9BACT